MKRLIPFFGLALALAFQAAAAPPFAAPQVLDADGNVLGTLVGLTWPPVTGPYDGVVVFRNGYLVRVNVDGSFPIATGDLWWTAPGCTGDAYLRDQLGNAATGANTVVFSPRSNSFRVPVGSGAVVSAPVTVESLESANGCNLLQYGEASQPGLTISGWQLAPFDAGKALGWTIAGNPAHVPGPLTFR